MAPVECGPHAGHMRATLGLGSPRTPTVRHARDAKGPNSLAGGIRTWQTGVFELFVEPARLQAALLDLGTWRGGAGLVACTAPRENPEPPS